MYKCVYVCMQVYMNMCMQTSMSVCMSVSVMHESPCMFVCMNAARHGRVCMCFHVNMYIYAETHP